MDAISAIFKKRILLLLFLVLYLFFAFSTYSDFGPTLDEYFVYRRGNYFYTKIRGNDETLKQSFAVKGENNENLLYYNSTYPAVLYMFNASESYERYHLLNMIAASIMFFIVYEVLLLPVKKPTLAILGPILMAMTPRVVGHIPANPKDVPFASAYLAALALIYISYKLPKRLSILLIGCASGIAASIRLLGLSLFPIWGMYQLLILKGNRKIRFKELSGFVIDMMLGASVAFLVLFVSQPYIASDPINNLPESLKINSAYPWNGSILFDGGMIRASDLPWYYIPKLLLITTPVGILISALYAVFSIRKKPGQKLTVLVIMSLVLHLGMYIFLRPVVYNGLRHYLFLLPQIIILAALGLIKLIEFGGLRRVFGYTLLLFTIVTIGRFYTLMHPYEYLYFNETVGGIKNTYAQYELDYWGATDKEQSLWLRNYIRENNIRSPAVSSCSTTFAVRYYIPEIIDSNPNPETSDYIICNDATREDELKALYPGSVIHRLEKNGTPLGFIYALSKE